MIYNPLPQNGYGCMINLARKEEEKILSSEFLEEIKRVREIKGISQEEVSERTNIKLAYIKAIENGNIDGLPGGVYNRAYIRSISEFLGINMKPFERNVESDEFIDEQKIKIEIGNNFNSHIPNNVIIASCVCLILVIYSIFYIMGSEEDNAQARLNDTEETIAEGAIAKTSPLAALGEENTRDFTISIIATEQTQVEITDANDNAVLSKIFLPNEAIVYPADDKEYYLYTPEIGVLEVYLDGVFVSNMPTMDKKDDRYIFTVDALFDAIEGQSNSSQDAEKADA